jgi:hypothetical protein
VILWRNAFVDLFLRQENRMFDQYVAGNSDTHNLFLIFNLSTCRTDAVQCVGVAI